jgi:hypothetical protein
MRESATPIWPLVLRLDGLPPGALDLAPQRLGVGAVEGRERGVGLAGSAPRRLYPDLDDAEEALDYPLHRVHGLDVIQGYRPLVFLDDAPPQAEDAACDLIGGGPPGEEAPEGREHRHDERPEQDEYYRLHVEPPARQEDHAGDDEGAQRTPDDPDGVDEHRRRVEVARLRAHPAPW